MAPALQIGRMEVPPDIEAKYNDYYDNQRTPRNLTVPGCLFVRRYHAVEGVPKYLTMYEFEHEKVPESSAWETHRNLISSISPIVDCGVHYVDVMCQMTRATPTRVQPSAALERSANPTIDVTRTRIT